MARGDGDPTPQPSGGDDQPDRDWDGEWRALAADLGGSDSSDGGRFRLGDRPTFGAGSGPRDYSPPPEDDSWEPPTPPPAIPDRRVRLAWLGILGGPLLLLLALIAFRQAPLWYVWLSIGLFVAGCAYGFRLLPRRRADPDDDGAQV